MITSEKWNKIHKFITYLNRNLLWINTKWNREEFKVSQNAYDNIKYENIFQ